MSVGMVPLPAFPVKAPSPTCCLPVSKPFPCHTFTRSKSSTLSSATAPPFDSIFGVAKPFALNLFADPYPLNPYGSTFYEKGGWEGGAISPGISLFPTGTPISRLALWLAPSVTSFSSNFPNSAEDSYCQKLAAPKSGFVILKPEGGLSNRDETLHFHRSIREHCAARLGLHQRPAARQIRFVVHRALAVRRRVAHRQGRRRHHPRHRISAHR